MLKKTITYTDFNGNEQTEDYYFNLSKTELLEIQYSEKKGFTEVLQSILDSQDLGGALDVIRYLVLKSYGIKSEDGKRFVKSEKVSQAFYQSPAYEALIMEFFKVDGSTEVFFRGIIPSDIAIELNKQQPNNIILQA